MKFLITVINDWGDHRLPPLMCVYVSGVAIYCNAYKAKENSVVLKTGDRVVAEMPLTKRGINRFVHDWDEARNQTRRQS